MHAALLIADVRSAQQSAMSGQLHKLEAAVGFQFAGYESVQMANVIVLLAQMCHPDVSERATAADVANSPWVKAAAAKSLPKCPIAW